MQQKPRSIKILDAFFILGGIAILILFTTVYLMPFRLDDVLHMDWAREHSFWDAFDIQKGEIVRSVRPVFAMTIWILTHSAGISHYFPWHLTLVFSFLIGLAYAGKTARYIANVDSALYFTVAFFWIAFLPILNVLFWYGDLTYTMELLFVAPAWYYGLRGLLEGRIGFWIVGIICGIFAVLAKEPALLLVHAIFVGTFVLFYKDFKTAWKKNKIIGIALYILFLAISIKLYFASPTKSNRFFNIGSLSTSELNFFISDRLRYYGESLLNPPARILLAAPLLYSLVRKFWRTESLFTVITIFIIAALIAFFLVHSIAVFSIILLITPIINIMKEKEKRAHLLLLPFAIVAIIILIVLLITVMLVKTQLTELSFVLLVIAGTYWSFLLREIWSLAKPYFEQKNFRIIFYSIGIIIIAGVSIFAFPQVKAKEQLLRNVRDVRTNANDALKWMGANLPQGSEILVGGLRLYGLGTADELTSKDDEYKLYAQYTFLQGYNRSYFHALSRYDIALGYLDDSVHLWQILDSCRSAGNQYLFLQNGVDVDRFHGLINGIHQLKASDKLVARFVQGPYPSEVWKLEK